MEDEEMTQEQFAQILRAERKRAGFTQQQMADAMGMAQSHYSLLERGKRRYTVLHLIRAKRKLGVSYAILTGERSRGVGSCRTQG
jgi:transcriptional regulator with XRE-family HTH domain